MIVASGIELRAGARLLLADASFQVAEGDRIGLVGRNGAGKTTLAKVLSGAALPAAGTVRASGTVATFRRTRGPGTWTPSRLTASCPRAALTSCATRCAGPSH